MELKKPIDLPDFHLLFQKYWRLIAFLVLVSGAVFTAAAFVLPKRFKSRATVNISTSYFQNALVREFIPEITDNSEIRAQRESLIRQAFNNEFIEKIGREHGLIKSERGTTRFLFEREEVRKKIEIVGLTPTTFQVGVLHSDREATYEMAQEALTRVLETLRISRTETLKAVRDSVRRQMDSMSLRGVSAPDPAASDKPAVLQTELEHLRAQIKALSGQYTSEHPKLVQLKQRAQLLEKWLTAKGESTEVRDGDTWVAQGRESTTANGDLFEDMSKKLNYLNIALDAESGGALKTVAVVEEPTLPLSPLWPNKPLLLLWGLVTGGLLASTIIVVLEYMKGSSNRAELLAKSLGPAYLGHLPYLTIERETTMNHSTNHSTNHSKMNHAVTNLSKPKSKLKSKSSEAATHDPIDQ